MTECVLDVVPDYWEVRLESEGLGTDTFNYDSDEQGARARFAKLLKEVDEWTAKDRIRREVSLIASRVTFDPDDCPEDPGGGLL